MKSSTALTTVLNSSTLLLSGSMGAVARLGRVAAGSIVAFSAGTRVAVTASATLVKSVTLIRGSFIALIASQGVVKVALTGFAITVLSLGRAIQAMTLAASVASVRLLFFRAGALAASAASSLFAARLAFGKSVMLAWSAVCKTAAGSLALLQVASKATALAISSVLLVPLLKVGVIVGIAAATWAMFGETLQQVFASVLKHASSFFNWIGGGLKTLWEDFSKYMGMIGDLLVEGKISEAASILWELIQLEWEKGCQAISDRFGETIDGIKGMLSSLAHEFSNFWENNKRGDSLWGGIVARITSLITGHDYQDIVDDMNRQAEYGLQQNALKQPKTAAEFGKDREEENKRRAERISALEKRLDERKIAHDERKAKEAEAPEIPEIKIDKIVPEIVPPDLDALTSGLDRLETSANFTRQMGTQSRWDILGGALSTGKVENKLDKIADSSKETADNTAAMKEGFTFDS